MKIKISSIKIGQSDPDKKRFRRDFGDIQKLVRSIQKHGLIQPIVVDKLDGDKYKYQLIAGERRLTAALYLGWVEIEAVIRDELNDLERKEIELEENVARKGLDWSEQIEALRQLDELKRSIHGSRLPGSIGQDGWTLKDTADSIGASLGTVSQDIKLARDLKDNPELAKKVKGSTKMVARKLVEREARADKMRKRIDKGDLDLSIDLILGKAEEKIKDLADESIHCLITDPPFAVEAISAVERGDLSGKYDRGTNVGDEDEMRDVYRKLMPELKRVMVPGGHFYMFFAIDWYEALKEVFTSNGFLVDLVPLIWSKRRTTMIPNPYHYIPSYEFIMFGCKAPRKRILDKPRANCLIDFPADAPVKRIHPLQKPFALIRLFIENSTVPGETILDCFAGSGIVLDVANKLGRRAIGFECDESNYLLASEFLEEIRK